MKIEIKVTGYGAIGKTYAAREMINAISDKFKGVNVSEVEELGDTEVWSVTVGGRK